MSSGRQAVSLAVHSLVCGLLLVACVPPPDAQPQRDARNDAVASDEQDAQVQEEPDAPEEPDATSDADAADELDAATDAEAPPAFDAASAELDAEGGSRPQDASSVTNDSSTNQAADAAAECGAPLHTRGAAELGNSAVDCHWTVVPMNARQQLLTPVQVPQAATLTALGIVAAESDGTCRLALYSDADRRPHMKLAETLLPLQTKAKKAPREHTQLAAGSYWVSAQCMRAAGPAHVYQQVDAAVAMEQLEHEFTDEPPTTFPERSTRTEGAALSLFIEVQEL